MKKSMIVFAVLAMTIFGTVGAVYAWFSAQGKVEGIQVSVADSGILINGQKDWNANVTFGDIFPGWSSLPIYITVENVSAQNIDMDLTAKVLFTGVNYEALSSAMEMAIRPPGSPLPLEYHTLDEWQVNDYPINQGSLVAGETKSFEIFFRLPAGTDNSIQDIDLGLSVLFTGTQKPS